MTGDVPLPRMPGDAADAGSQARTAPCEHKTLFFGSGAFYLFCRECHAAWVAVKFGNGEEIDYERGPTGHSGKERTEREPGASPASKGGSHEGN